MPPTVAVVDCGWTGMEAGESCSQWLALAVVEGGSSSDADAAGSRRGSGGEGEGGGGYRIHQEGGRRLARRGRDGRRHGWGLGQSQLHFSLSTCTVLDVYDIQRVCRPGGHRNRAPFLNSIASKYEISNATTKVGKHIRQTCHVGD